MTGARDGGKMASSGVAAAAGGPRPLDRRNALPLWAQLRDDLHRRIAAGTLLGTFPGELALVAEYGVSRHTVRESLRELRAGGSVSAERGQAPRLTVSAKSTQPLGAPYSLFASIEAVGHTLRNVVRALDVRTDPVVANRLGLPKSTPLLHLERLWLADDQPLAVDQVWWPERMARPLLGAAVSHIALYEELDRRCGIKISGGREELRAVVASAAERNLLEIGTDIGVFAVERLGCAGGRPIEWRHALVRGDRFVVSPEFLGRPYGHSRSVAGLEPTGRGGAAYQPGRPLHRPIAGACSRARAG